MRQPARPRRRGAEEPSERSDAAAPFAGGSEGDAPSAGWDDAPAQVGGSRTGARVEPSQRGVVSRELVGERERQEYRRSRVLGALGSRRERRVPLDGLSGQSGAGRVGAAHGAAAEAPAVEMSAAGGVAAEASAPPSYARTMDAGASQVIADAVADESAGASDFDQRTPAPEYDVEVGEVYEATAPVGATGELVQPADALEQPVEVAETAVATSLERPTAPKASDNAKRGKRGKRRRKGRAVSHPRGGGQAQLGRDEAPATAPTVLGDDVVSAAFAERLARREAGQRKARRRRMLSAISALTVVGAIVWLLFFSPLLALDAEKISVESSSEYVDAGKVREMAASQASTPLPRLSTGALQRNIAELPGVLSVEVSRDWPRGLQIVVTPREPMAATVKGQEFVLVGKEGTAIAQVAELPPGIPTLAVPLAAPEDTEGYEKVTAALSVLEILPSELRAQVAEATATSSDAVTLRMTNGATVRWGSTDEAELKAAVLEILVAQEPGSEYDVSVPDRPTVR